MKRKGLRLRLDRETVSRLDPTRLENIGGGISILSNCAAGCEPTFDAGTCGRTCNTATLCGTRYC